MGDNETLEALQKQRTVPVQASHGRCPAALQIQALCGNDIPTDLLQTLIELLCQLLVAHDLGSLAHLPNEFFQTAEESNQGALVRVCHFAVANVSKVIFLILFSGMMLAKTYQISENGLPCAQAKTVSIN
jgi:hypothetical protein